MQRDVALDIDGLCRVAVLIIEPPPRPQRPLWIGHSWCSGRDPPTRSCPLDCPLTRSLLGATGAFAIKSSQAKCQVVLLLLGERYGSEGWEFESLRARHSQQRL